MTRTALVLGGGGITGIAWELGILKGLADRGFDLTGADRVVGTSAGSFVGAQITSSQPLSDLYDEQLVPPDPEIGAQINRSTFLPLLAPLLLPRAAVERRRRIGRLSHEAHQPGGDRRVEIIRTGIGVDEWPTDRELLITSVDTDTGEFVTFDRHSGVPLERAVAASCAVPIVWPAVTIDGRQFMDGGMRSSTNADVARGADVVVVLAPLPRAFSVASRTTTQLRKIGPVRSVVISPDSQAALDIGANVLNPTMRAAAARTGLRQAADEVERIAAVWPG